SGQEISGKTRVTRLDRVHVDAHAAHARGVQALERGIARVLVDVHDAAAALRTDFAHRVEHAGVVAPVGAGLYEDITTDPQGRCMSQVILQGSVRRLVPRVAGVGIALGRAEDVEVAVAVHSRMNRTLLLSQTPLIFSTSAWGIGIPSRRRFFRDAASGSPGTSTGCAGSSAG